MFRLTKPSSGSLLLCFAKVMIIKTVSYNTSLWNQFGRVAAYLSSPTGVCVQCALPRTAHTHTRQ